MITFGPFRLDREAAQLWRGDEPLTLPPRPLGVLAYLAERPGRVVPAAELLATVWAGTHVTRTSVKVCIRAVREALGDDALAPCYVETVGREGYRFRADVRGVVPAPPRAAAAHVVVGRERERAALRSWFAGASDGARCLVFVTGEPGIGKTALIDAFLDGVRAAGDARIGRGQCLEQFGKGEAYLPVLEAIGQLCHGPDGGRMRALLARCAPTWLAQMPAVVAELGRVPGGESASRDRMLREAAELIEAVAAERPLVLVLEDIHWSDRATLDLVAYLAERREAARLLVLATYRPAEVVVSGHPVGVLARGLHARRRCVELPLELLGERATGDFLAARLDSPDVHPEFVRLMHARTDGLPLFLLNLMEHCVRQGLVVREGGRWRLQADAGDLGLPAGLVQSITQRLEKLAARDRRVLETASVVGLEFVAGVVAVCSGAPADDIEECCERLAARRQFVRASGIIEWPGGSIGGTYAFEHALYQQVLYGRVPAARRARLHRVIAECEETRFGPDAGQHAAELALHWERGRDAQRAVPWLHRAAETATARGAYDETIMHLKKALALLEGWEDAAERCRLRATFQLALGAPLLLRAGFASEEAEHAGADALRCAREVGNTFLTADALTTLGAIMFMRADFPCARAYAEELLRLSDVSGLPWLPLLAHHTAAPAVLYQGAPGPALAHFEQGIAALPQPAPRLLEIVWMGSIMRSVMPLDLLGRRDEAARRGRMFLETPCPALQRAQALYTAAWLHRSRGEREPARRRTEELLAFATEHGFPDWHAAARILRGWVLADDGGAAEIAEGLAAFRARGSAAGTTHYLALLADAHRIAGQPDDGLRALAEARAFAERTGERLWEAELHRLHGELLLLRGGRGARAAAETALRQAWEVARAQEAHLFALRALTALCRLGGARARTGDAGRALDGLYASLVEGRETVDLRAARAWLDDTGDCT